MQHTLHTQMTLTSGGSEAELQDLTIRLERTAETRRKAVMMNSRTQLAATSIALNGLKLAEVNSFKYLGSTLTKDGSSTKEEKTKLSLAASAMTRLNVICKSNSISFPENLKLFKSLVVSILLHGCEIWILTADLERRLQAFI